MPKARLLLLLLLNETPTLTTLEKQSTRDKKRREIKLSAAERESREIPNHLSALPTAAQPRHPVLAPSCAFLWPPCSTTTGSWSEQGADPAENYFSKNEYMNGLKKKKN